MMPHIVLLLSVLAIGACAADDAALISLDFSGEALPHGVYDNTYKGERPTLALVPAVDAARGSELAIRVAPGGFAQVVLGNLGFIAGATYKGSAVFSADATGTVRFFLRMGPKPYIVYASASATIGPEPTTVAFTGTVPEDCPDGCLMLYTEAQTTVRVDNVRLQRVVSPAP